MTGYWDAVSAIYDWQLPLERRALSAALDLLAPGRDEHLLDVGTGTGGLLRQLAGRPGFPERAVGVDTSAGMLARVGPLPAGWELVRADARALPYADGSFDVAAAAYVVHILDGDDVDRVLTEVRRTVKPGGRLVTVTPTAPRSFLGLPYEATTRVLGRLFPAGLGLRPFDPAPALRRTGFEPERGRYVSGGYPSLCVLAAG